MNYLFFDILGDFYSVYIVSVNPDRQNVPVQLEDNFYFFLM